MSKTRRFLRDREREDLYRACTLEVVSVLARCRVRLLKRRLWKLVVRIIETKTQGQGKGPQFERFKQLLRDWLKREDELGWKLARVLHNKNGPIRPEDKDQYRRRLIAGAPELAAVLFPNTNPRLRPVRAHTVDKAYKFDMQFAKAKPMEAQEPGKCPVCGAPIQIPLKRTQQRQ
jgi:hypothetical protein